MEFLENTIYHSLKDTKYLEINLTKNVQDYYSEK